MATARKKTADEVESTPQALQAPPRPAAHVSILIPVLDEAMTIAPLVEKVRSDPLVLEVLVVDDGSTDGTPELAAKAGAQVIMSTLMGKGASLEDGVKVAKGEIVLVLDGDLLQLSDDIVEKMTTPIAEDRADMVKASFNLEGGRLTLMTTKPLLTAFFPELDRFGQPLTGIMAARTSLLRKLRFESDHGVDVGLLIDASMKGAKITDVYIGWIDHQSQTLQTIGDVAKQLTRVILDRAWRYDRLNINYITEMEETDRRTRAQALPSVDPSSHQGKFALFDMDGVLLDGRFAATLAERVGAQSELTRLLANQVLPDEERVAAIAALFAGVDQDTFQKTALSIPLVPGASEVVIALRRTGYRVGVVTNGFDVAAEIVRRRVFADFRVAHLMSFRRGVATGQVTLSPTMLVQGGCEQHACCKANAIKQLERSAGLIPERSLVVGDGEVDICMFRSVGLPVAFRPKSPEVEQAAKFTIHESLLELLRIPGVLPDDLSSTMERLVGDLTSDS